MIVFNCISIGGYIGLYFWVASIDFSNLLKLLIQHVLLLMEEILPQLIYGIYRSFHRVLYIPGGAGFLPSTLGTHRNPQSYRIQGFLAGICQQQQASRAMLKSMPMRSERSFLKKVPESCIADSHWNYWSILGFIGVPYNHPQKDLIFEKPFAFAQSSNNISIFLEFWGDGSIFWIFRCFSQRICAQVTVEVLFTHQITVCGEATLHTLNEREVLTNPEPQNFQFNKITGPGLI